MFVTILFVTIQINKCLKYLLTVEWLKIMIHLYYEILYPNENKQITDTHGDGTDL